MSSLPPIDGTLAGRGFGNGLSGGIAGSPPLTGSLAGNSNESAENSAVAELGGLISSLGTLSAQAQSLPLSVPTLPGAQQPPSYMPQSTDYLGFAENSD
jgi:hypothetical protein